MEKIFYEVHSDCDENNIRECFEGKGAKQAAIAYAKRNKEEMTWVDRVVEYDEGNYDYECVWSYDVEEDDPESDKKELKYLLNKENCCSLDKLELYRLQELLDKYGYPEY